MCEQEKINFMYETIPLRQLDGGIRVPMLKCTIFIKTKIKSKKLQAEKEDRSCKKKRSAPFGSFNANYQKATLYSGEEESLGQLTVWSEFEARPCNTG